MKRDSVCVSSSVCVSVIHKTFLDTSAVTCHPEGSWRKNTHSFKGRECHPLSLTASIKYLDNFQVSACSANTRKQHWDWRNTTTAHQGKCQKLTGARHEETCTLLSCHCSFLSYSWALWINDWACWNSLLKQTWKDFFPVQVSLCAPENMMNMPLCYLYVCGQVCCVHSVFVCWWIDTGWSGFLWYRV